MTDFTAPGDYPATRPPAHWDLPVLETERESVAGSRRPSYGTPTSGKRSGVWPSKTTNSSRQPRSRTT